MSFQICVSSAWNVTTDLPVTSLCLLEGEELWQEQVPACPLLLWSFPLHGIIWKVMESHCVGARRQRKNRENLGDELVEATYNG